MSGERAYCYRCRKAAVACVCASIVPVANRTPILILQHHRERDHPLGTARFARLGLTRVQLETAPARPPADAAVPPRPLPVGSALLFPGAGAQLLDELPAARRPRALLVLDGTWSTAGKLYRDHPWVRELPRVALRPSAPGNYRIRKEPRPECLSTIESVVAALRVLEPETAGLDALIDAFTKMVDFQLEHARVGPGRRRTKERATASRAAIPAALQVGDDAVLVYAESTHQGQPDQQRARRLVYCAAQRLGDGATLGAYLRTDAPLSARLLAFMGLDAGAIVGGVGPEVFAEALRSFTGAHPTLVAWNQTSLDLVQAAAGTDHPTVVLKGVYGNLDGRAQGSVEDTLARRGLLPEPTRFPGRAGVRMAAAFALLRAFQGAGHTRSSSSA